MLASFFLYGMDSRFAEFMHLRLHEVPTRVGFFLPEKLVASGHA